MAKSTSGAYTVTLSNVAGAHAMMQRLYDHLVAVGLTPITDGTYYDGSPSGTDAQQPTTNGTDSNWMGFLFTDGAQTSYPIAVWFRTSCRLHVDTTAGNIRWYMEGRISEGATSGGSAAGVATGALQTPYSTWTTSTSHTTTGYTCIGDRVRYSGDALTVLIGIRGVSTASSPASYRNYMTLHVERRRDRITGDIIGGYAYYYLPQTTGSSSTAMLNSAYSAAPTFGTVSGASVTNLGDSAVATRPLIWRYRSEDGKALVNPVTYEDANGRTNFTNKLFLIPREFATDMAEYTLDFTGAELKYLSEMNTVTSIANPSSYNVAMLFEWE